MKVSVSIVDYILFKLLSKVKGSLEVCSPMIFLQKIFISDFESCTVNGQRYIHKRCTHALRIYDDAVRWIH